MFKSIFRFMFWCMSRILESTMLVLFYYLVTEAILCWAGNNSAFYCEDATYYLLLPIILGLACGTFTFLIRYGTLNLDFSYFHELADIRANYGSCHLL